MRRPLFLMAIVSVISAGSPAFAGPLRNVQLLASLSERVLRYGPPRLEEEKASGEEERYVSLFNGRDLDGWQLRRANRRGYVVEGGLLVCPEDGGGYLFTKGQYDDFRFRFEFRLSKGANNGVAIRSPLVDKRPAYEGIEIQILDNVGYPRKLRPTQYHGSIYDVVPAKRGALRPVGQWNEQEIICRGRRITVIVNEVVILDANLDDIQDSEVLQKHAGLARTGGHIGFLGHGSRVEFRRIRIRNLAKDGSD